MTTFSYPYRRDPVTGLTTATPFNPELANWLNKLDAMTDYEWRRKRPFTFWQRQFKAGAPVSGWAVVYHSEMSEA